jgi:hypothetical protein
MDSESAMDRDPSESESSGGAAAQAGTTEEPEGKSESRCGHSNGHGATQLASGSGSGSGSGTEWASLRVSEWHWQILSRLGAALQGSAPRKPQWDLRRPFGNAHGLIIMSAWEAWIAAGPTEPEGARFEHSV